MSTVRFRTLSVFAMTLAIASSAWAVDEGQSQPRLNNNTVSLTSTPVDVIPLTNGAGNVKGFQCTKFGTSTANVRVHFYVDGGAAQTLNPGDSFWIPDANGDVYSPVIPMNVRFDTSIRVNLQKLSGTGAMACWVSGGFD